jgi:hypothetical protein
VPRRLQFRYRSGLEHRLQFRYRTGLEHRFQLRYPSSLEHRFQLRYPSSLERRLQLRSNSVLDIDERARPAREVLHAARNGVVPALDWMGGAVDTHRMAKKPEPPKPIVWNVYKIASKAVWLGGVEAMDEDAAMQKGAAEFKVPPNRLLAIRR